VSEKIELDKYYTSEETAIKCINILFEKVEKESISEYIEPSAGNGSFSLNINGCIGYDIEPEHSSIIEQDFLELDMKYKKGRCFVGNPPFGSRMNLAQKFFKKCINYGDFVAFILPISQLQNTNSLFEFDLIYSKDLGKISYSNRKIHCCFNVFKRPKNGLNKRLSNKIDGIEIVRQDSKKFANFEHDIRMCYWGDGSAGKILSDDESYSAEYKIKITHPKKDKIINLLRTINWRAELNCVAMLKIQQFHIINLIRNKSFEEAE